MNDGVTLCHGDSVLDFFEMSDISYGVLEGYSADIYTIDDAVSKFLETLSWVDLKIKEIYHGFDTLHELSLECPFEQDYDGSFTRLGEDLRYFCEMRDVIQSDLEKLLGRSVPF